MQDPPSPTENLSVRQLAAHWNVSTTTIRRQISQGLPHQRVGQQIRIRLRDAEAWQRLETQKLNDYLKLRAAIALPIGQFAELARTKAMTLTLISPTCRLNYDPKKRMFSGSIRDPLLMKTKTKWIPTAYQDEAAARQYLVDFETKLHAEHKSPTPTGLPTIRNLFEKWGAYLRDERRNKRNGKLDPKTAQKWLGCIKHFALTTSIADVPITNETFHAKLCADWVRKLCSKAISTHYIRDCAQALRQMINDARRNDWVSLYGNPVSDDIVRGEVPIAVPKTGRNNPNHLSRDQAIQLMQAKINAPLSRQVFYLVAICTGARLRELWGLSWKHIDLENDTIEIERQVLKGGTKSAAEFGPPKSESHRTLPMHPLVKRSLEFWKAQFPTVDLNGPVFPREETWDLYQCEEDINTKFRRDLTQAGISDKYEDKFNFHIHSMRRTFLTLLSDAGVKDEAEHLAGHAVEGVRRHYIKENLPKYRPVILKLPFSKVEPGFLPAQSTKQPKPKRMKRAA